ncbi:cation efflux family protein [Ancylostoma ceylanicum]|uniref:Cation efflux family protein n=1 Tax=Ancylostoma ceylanicum TaxID=53326 RepID=A0A0D6LMK6_9BILA|nr:cation efflux family protein [Ancylostoma ceylanicum]
MTATNPSENSENSSVDIEATKDGHDENAKGRRAEKVLWAVAVLSLVFIIAEFVGGFFASSLAIMTDAGHMLSDLLSFVISIVAIRTARQPPSKRLSWGYDRAEVLGAMISVIILWVLTTVLVLLAIERIVNNDLTTPRHMDFNAVKEDLSALENVQSVHDLHMWSLNMDKTALSVHLAIDSSEHALSTVTAARQLIRQKYGISKATVQVESYDKSMNSCEMCLT